MTTQEILTRLFLTPLADKLKETMNSPADQIIWLIFDDKLTVSQLTKEQTDTIVAEYGTNWVHDLGIDLVESQL